MEDLRRKIRHNFLKQIIFRLDFDGVLESDVEKCVESLRDKFFDSGFRYMDNRMLNQVDLQVKIDLNIPDENRLSFNNVNPASVYCFSSDCNELMELSKTFFTLTVDIDKAYKSFDKYISILTEAVETIKNSSPYFRALRMGLRKINIYFFGRLDLLAYYFKKAAFNIDEILDQISGCSCTASNMVTLLHKGEYCINYIRDIQEGVMQQEDSDQKTVYQVVLDIDVYMDDCKEICQIFADKESAEAALKKQNTVEFEIFIKSLTDDFVEKMKSDAFQTTTILQGVE